MTLQEEKRAQPGTAHKPTIPAPSAGRRMGNSPGIAGSLFQPAGAARRRAGWVVDELRGFFGEPNGFMGVPGGQAASGPQREPHSMRMAGEARRKLREACFSRRCRQVNRASLWASCAGCGRVRRAGSVRNPPQHTHGRNARRKWRQACFSRQTRPGRAAATQPGRAVPAKGPGDGCSKVARPGHGSPGRVYSRSHRRVHDPSGKAKGRQCRPCRISIGGCA